MAVVDEIETDSIFEKAQMVECRIHEEEGQLVVAYDGPSTEQLNAVLLRLRLFVRRDDLSVARMAELYDDPGVSETWKVDHRRWRRALNDRLDRVAAEGVRGVLTHGQVLDMFLYGRLGHLKQDDTAYACTTRPRKTRARIAVPGGSVREAAKAWGVSKSTAARWINAGQSHP